MTPFTDTMSLVNRQEIDVDAGNGIQKTAVTESFWGDINETQVPTCHLIENFCLLACGQAAVDQARLYPQFSKTVDLVFHQRNQRRYDDRRAGSGKAW